MPLWSKENVKWIGNALGVLASLALLGFPGLLGYVAGFVVNVYVPRWAGWEG